MERVLIVVAEIGVSRNKLVVRRRAATQRYRVLTTGGFGAPQFTTRKRFLL